MQLILSQAEKLSAWGKKKEKNRDYKKIMRLQFTAKKTLRKTIIKLWLKTLLLLPMGNAVACNDLCCVHLMLCAVLKTHQYQLLPETGTQTMCSTHCHSSYIPRRFYSTGMIMECSYTLSIQKDCILITP